MAMVCDKCGETFTLEEWNKINRKIEVRPIIGGEEGWGVLLCPSCMAKLNDWLTPDEQKPDTENKNEWKNMTTQPQCGAAVEIKLENGDLDIAYRRYNDKRWFQSSGEWVSSDVKIVAWRYID
jgi:hypothetical protein